jgi:hypothetical protein
MRGIGNYQPDYFAHFPSIARGHGIGRKGKCAAPTCVVNTKGRGEKHVVGRSFNAKQWEKVVGK